MTATSAPVSSKDAPRQDDGYFGPDSVTWKVFADPGTAIGGGAALLLQALEPGMMRHFDKVSITSDSPEESVARAARTSAYLRTMAFGDRAHVDAAAAHVDMLHERATWTDPETGAVEVAKWPSWQQWTHNTVVWAMLRAADAFGLDLTTEEQDRFIVEQHKAAELLRVPGPLPATRAELDAYIEAEGATKALSLPAARVGHSLRHPEIKGGPVKRWAARIINDSVVALLPEWARLMWALEDRSSKRLAKAQRWTKRFVGLARRNKSTADLIQAAVGDADLHPYQKVRAPKR